MIIIPQIQWEKLTLARSPIQVQFQLGEQKIGQGKWNFV